MNEDERWAIQIVLGMLDDIGKFAVFEKKAIQLSDVESVEITKNVIIPANRWVTWRDVKSILMQLRDGCDT